MLNQKTSFLIPPRGNAGDGFASQREPKSLAEELAEESSLVRVSALKDAVTYLVDNDINNAGHDVRSAINIRYNLKWSDCDAIISKAKTLVGPEIAKVKAERDKAEQCRIHFEELVNLFAALDVEIQQTNGSYNLIGLSESAVHLCAEILTADEGTK
jgi:hypothetical protein